MGYLFTILSNSDNVPETEFDAGDSGRRIVETVVTNRAPHTVAFDLQTTFKALLFVSDQPQIYRRLI